MKIEFPKSPLGAFALAVGLGCGFLGAGVLAMRLPQGVVPQPAPPTMAAVPELRPALRYVALRSPIIAAHPGLSGSVELELGVAVAPEDEDRVRVFLREQSAPMQAELADAVLTLAADLTAMSGDWSGMREALPRAMLNKLNDCFEETGQGRPVHEVFVTTFIAR